MSVGDKIERISSPLEKGITLVIVLWLITSFSLIVLTLNASVRSNATIVSNSLLSEKERFAMMAVFEHAVANLIAERDEAQSTLTDGRETVFTYKNYQLGVTIQDTNGLLDINKADEELIKSFLSHNLVNPKQVDRIADAILDWRDEDSKRRADGAEEFDYRRAKLGIVPANSPFIDKSQLLQIIGINDQVFRKLAPYITVFSHQNTINPITAHPNLLKALPRIKAENVDEAIAVRNRRSFDEFEVADLLTTADNWISIEEGPAFTITVKHVGKGAHTGTILIATVLLLENEVSPFSILRWQFTTEEPFVIN